MPDKLYKIITETAFDCAYFLDAEGFAYVSPSCGDLTGYSPEHFMADSRLLETIIHPEHRELFAAHLLQIRQDGNAGRLECRAVRRDGSEGWIEHACRPVYDEKGALLGLRGSIRNIDKFKQAEQARLESEARYRAMIELQGQAVCRWLPDTTLTFVNDEYCRLTGRERGELLGLKWISMIPPDAREEVSSVCRSLQAEQRVYLYEHEIVGPDGRILWMQWVDAPVFDEAGSLMEFQSIGRDMTGHRKAMMDLQDSEERFRAFMSQLPALAFIKDEKSRILFTNTYMDEQMGSQGWIGRDALDNFSAEVASRVMADDRRVIEGGRPVVIEEVVSVKSGETRIFETRKFPIGREGKPPMLGAIAVDITEKKRAEDALRASEERYRMLAEASHDVIFVIDRRDSLAYVNNRGAEILGEKQENLIGTPRKSLNQPADMLARQEAAQDVVFSTGQPHSVEGPYLPRKDGSPGWYSANLVPLKGESGEVQAVLGVARDITELRDRAQRLEESNIALKVLLRNRVEDMQEFEEKLLSKFKNLILPSVEQLRKTGLTPRQNACLEVVEMSAGKILSASGMGAGLHAANFTPLEMRVIDYIREDRTTKEIATDLHLSPRTVEYYRNKIRHKLGLKNRHINLRAYLLTLP